MTTTIRVGDRVREIALATVFETPREGTVVDFERAGSITGARVAWDGLQPGISQWTAQWKLEVLGVIDALGGLDGSR